MAHLTTGRTHGVNEWRDAVAATGRDVRIVQHPPLDANEVFADGECVVVNGTATDVARVSKARRWAASAALGSAEAFACHTFIDAWGSHALQQERALVSAGELARDRDRWIGTLGVNGRVFVRPDAHDKAFDGSLLDAGDLAAWYSQFSLGIGDASTRCLIARPREIEAEWRLFMHNERVVTGSSYLVAGRLDRTRAPEADIIDFAESLARDPYPSLPSAFVLDVCRCEGRPWLVEVGSALSSAPYAADLRAIVEAVSAAAARTGEEP